MNSDAISIVRNYFDAIENGAQGESLRFFTEDVIQEEFPNRLVPNGATRDLAALEAAAEKGRKVVTRQRFEILNVIASGNQVAVETVWTGTLAVPIGSIPAGGEMKARFAIFLELRDGRIARQRNYDCFDPF